MRPARPAIQVSKPDKCRRGDSLPASSRTAALLLPPTPLLRWPLGANQGQAGLLLASLSHRPTRTQLLQGPGPAAHGRGSSPPCSRQRQPGAPQPLRRRRHRPPRRRRRRRASPGSVCARTEGCLPANSCTRWTSRTRRCCARCLDWSCWRATLWAPWQSRRDVVGWGVLGGALWVERCGWGGRHHTRDCKRDCASEGTRVGWPGDAAEERQRGLASCSFDV